MPKKRKITIPRMKPIAKDHIFSYKRAEELARYVTEQGYIVSRKVSGLTAKQQRTLAQEVKRARFLALLPFTQTL